MFAKAKQQLIEREICSWQTKGGNSNLTRHNKTRKHINNIKRERGTTIDDILFYYMIHHYIIHYKMSFAEKTRQ